MIRLLVVFAWLSLIPAVLYRLRNVSEVRGYCAGFLLIWHSILTLKNQEDRYKEAFADCGSSDEKGMATAAFTVLVAAILLLVFVGYTIYWGGLMKFFFGLLLIQAILAFVSLFVIPAGDE